MPGRAGHTAKATVRPVISHSKTRSYKGKKSVFGMVSANNSPQTPCLTITCRSGHMRSSYLTGVFPSASGRVHAFGAGRQDIPCIANRHRTGSRQTATAVPGRTEARTGQRPGAGPQRPRQDPLQKPHTWRTPAGASGPAGSCADTRSSTAAPAASSECPASPGAT